MKNKQGNVGIGNGRLIFESTVNRPLTRLEKLVFNWVYKFAKRRKLDFDLTVEGITYRNVVIGVEGNWNTCTTPGIKLNVTKTDISEKDNTEKDTLIIKSGGCGQPTKDYSKKISVNCSHKVLLLKGNKQPKDFPKNKLWLKEPYLECQDCGNHIGVPDDLTTIKNIPHLPVDGCAHHKDYQLMFGWFPIYLQCLCCGYERANNYRTKLDVKGGKEEFK